MFRLLITLACLFFLSSELLAHDDYDLIIRNGRIVDGTGNPWFFGDLAVKSDRIVALGTVASDAAAKRTIDAKAMIVAPGFIDVHSHSDSVLFEDGSAKSKLYQGVTTDVLGEATSGGPNLGKIGGKKIVLPEKEHKLDRLADYFEALDESGIGINVATYVGIRNVWASVMGDSFERPTPAQFDEMKTILDEAMSQGALGLSSMLADAQALIITTDDLVELCKVVAKHHGLYSTHIRNEGTEVFSAVREAIEVGRKAKLPVDIIHIKIADQRLWGRMVEVVDLISTARQQGIDIQANVYPYTRGNNDLVTILPPWAHEGGKAKLIARLKNTADRAKMKQDIMSGLDGWYDHYLAVGGDWSRMLISAQLTAGNRDLQGLTMDKIITAKTSKDSKMDPLDIMFDFLIEEGGSIPTIYAHHTEADMTLAMKQPWCSIGSDGSALSIEGVLRKGHPHPRNFGTFPRVLGLYARDQKMLTLEDAIRKMTSLNASKVGLKDRGQLRVGAFADITIFDPEKIIDKSTFLEPFQYCEGIKTVILNGKVALDEGKATDIRAGRTLRRDQ